MSGIRKTLFRFYPDKVSFRAHEFIGLTEEEVHSHFQCSGRIFIVFPAHCEEIADVCQGLDFGLGQKPIACRWQPSPPEFHRKTRARPPGMRTDASRPIS